MNKNITISEGLYNRLKGKYPNMTWESRLSLLVDKESKESNIDKPKVLPDNIVYKNNIVYKKDLDNLKNKFNKVLKDIIEKNNLIQ